MDNTGKIIELLRGGLSVEYEKEVFTELAVDKDLRVEFRCLASISGSINSGMNSFAPSTALKSRIFEKAGMSIPVEPLKSEAQSHTKPAFYKSGLFTGLLSAAAAAIISIFLTLQFTENNRANDQKSASLNGIETYSLAGNMGNIHNTATAKTGLYANKAPVRYIYKYDKQSDGRNFNKHADDATSLLTSGNESLPLAPYFPESSEIKDVSFSPQISLSDFRYLTPPEAVNDGNEELSGLSVELKGATTWNIPKESIEPASPNKLNNLGISILYKLNEDWTIGFGADQGTFFTEYTGTEPDGSLYRYRQQPNLTTFSLFARCYPWDFYKFRTFFQSGVGFNKAGFVLRPAAGLEYVMYPDLSFVISGAYSKFWFSHQGTVFSASKYGLNYGILFKF